MSEKNTVTLTDSLTKRIRELQAERGNPALMLRVSVQGGGCQGFEYEFAFAEKTEPDDLVFEKDGIKIVIDTVSLNFLGGATIDFVSDLQGAQFQVKNPNAASSCGCGTSFSV